MASPWYSPEELKRHGFRSFGRDVLVSRLAVFYGQDRISLGNRCRIDDYCHLSAGSGGIEIGEHVHLAPMVTLSGAGAIRIEDFSGLSAKVSVFSSTDDYLGFGMTNPTVPDRWRCVKTEEILVGRHSIIGAGSVLLPGSRLPEGVAVGALSVVSKELESWSVYAGNPVRKLIDRRRDPLELERRWLEEGA